MVPMEIFQFVSSSWYLLYNITNTVWNTSHWYITNYNINFITKCWLSRLESLVNITKEQYAKLIKKILYCIPVKVELLTFAFKVTSWVHIGVIGSPEFLQAISIKLTKNENVCTTQLYINLSFYLESMNLFSLRVVCLAGLSFFLFIFYLLWPVLLIAFWILSF